MAFLGTGLGSPLALGFDNTQALWKSWTISAPKAAPAKQTAPAPAKAPPTPPPPPPDFNRYGTDQRRTPTTYVDPYAKWGGKANYDRAVGDYNSAKTNAYSSINDAIGDTGNKLNSSVLDYLDSLRAGQRGIDRAAVQNEMSRESGRLGVMDMVGQGIRSGGVMLNNKGATNSSAGEALARAYGDIGRRELSKVGNQYELGVQGIADQQLDLQEQTQQFQRHYGEQKQSAVNSIVQDASSKLAALNAAAQNASLADRIDIEQQKAAIRNQALNALAGYDNTLNSGVSSVTAATTDDNRAKAKAAILAGTAPEEAFSYTTSAPAQFQQTGPYSSPLQVFSAPRRNDDNLLPTGV